MGRRCTLDEVVRGAFAAKECNDLSEDCRGSASHRPTLAAFDYWPSAEQMLGGSLRADAQERTLGQIGESRQVLLYVVRRSIGVTSGQRAENCTMLRQALILIKVWMG